MLDIVQPPRPRRYLGADALIRTLRKRFESVEDSRDPSSVGFTMADTLASAYAMFSLKEPSLLNFQSRIDEPAIKKLYQLNAIPCDSTMRTILDGIELEELNQCFADVFYELQRGGILKRFVFDRGRYLLVTDGTEYFCSSSIHCSSCLQRTLKNGEVQYYHQAVVATLVHPEQSAVIVLAVEPIVKQDGSNKNDCERNANRRLLRRVRKLHPKLKLIVVEDGLSSNAPHIADLQELKMQFLLMAKPSDHQHLFAQVIQASDENRHELLSIRDPLNDSTLLSETQYVEGLAINASNLDTRVNFLQHFEYDPTTGDTRKRFSWVTDIQLAHSDYLHYVRGGRSRWKIENETFNTLKNQGYHYEHNYGHGEKNLSIVLMLLMFLAFLVDQVQQICCPLFQETLKKLGTRRLLWDYLRSHVRCYVFSSFAELWRAILTGSAVGRAPPVG